VEIGVSAFAAGLITAWTLVAVALLALAIQLWIAFRARRIDLAKAVETFRSLDIDAFRNLIDPAEDAFLRDNLSPKKFREIRRQRAWAAFNYAWEVGASATALAKVGHAAQRSSDPQTAASGVQLSENALRLRMQTMRACLRFLTEVLLPDLQPRSLPPVVDHYERAARTLVLLGGSFSSATQEFVRR
jgi:hypothetical protein